VRLRCGPASQRGGEGTNGEQRGPAPGGAGPSSCPGACRCQGYVGIRGRAGVRGCVRDRPVRGGRERAAPRSGPVRCCGRRGRRRGVAPGRSCSRWRGATAGRPGGPSEQNPSRRRAPALARQPARGSERDAGDAGARLGQPGSGTGSPGVLVVHRACGGGWRRTGGGCSGMGGHPTLRGAHAPPTTAWPARSPSATPSAGLWTTGRDARLTRRGGAVRCARAATAVPPRSRAAADGPA
jgi:hypothetical protein